MSCRIRKRPWGARHYSMRLVIKELVWMGALQRNMVCIHLTTREIEPLRWYLDEIWIQLCPKSSFKKNIRAKKYHLRLPITKGLLPWNLIEAKLLYLYLTRRIKTIEVIGNLKAWTEWTKQISTRKNIWTQLVSQKPKAFSLKINLVVRFHQW